MNKRAVSPLVATVLLIAFAVSLGAVIMNLGVNLASSACQDVKIEFLETADGPRVCQTSEQVQMTLSNKGYDIAGFRVSLVGDASFTQDFQEPVKQLTQHVQRVPTQNVGSVDIMTVIPIIGGDVFCHDKQIAVESIPDC
ncbi:MAG: archaellin/type IV pilin N-terminal domain-containing protein, partial [Candidatus Woesearchaeota archaeon]